MRVTNEQFARALGCLYKSGKAKDQKELATMTGITETTISRIVNDRVKRPSDETIRKLLKVFPDALGFEEKKNVPNLDGLEREVKLLQDQLTEKDDHIATLKARISDLQNIISLLRSSGHTKDGTDQSNSKKEKIV